jgi:hypothetical protein
MEDNYASSIDPTDLMFINDIGHVNPIIFAVKRDSAGREFLNFPRQMDGCWRLKYSILSRGDITKAYIINRWWVITTQM